MATGPVLVDTGVFGADLSPSSKPLADLYADVLAGRNILISFITVAELRYGALRLIHGRTLSLRLNLGLGLGAIPFS